MVDDMQTRRCEYCEKHFDVTDEWRKLNLAPNACSAACDDGLYLKADTNNHGQTFVSLDELKNVSIPATEPSVVTLRDEVFAMLGRFANIFISLTPKQQDFLAWFCNNPRKSLQDYATKRGVSRESARQAIDAIRIKFPEFNQCWPKKVKGNANA